MLSKIGPVQAPRPAKPGGFVPRCYYSTYPTDFKGVDFDHFKPIEFEAIKLSFGFVFRIGVLFGLLQHFQQPFGGLVVVDHHIMVYAAGRHYPSPPDVAQLAYKIAHVVGAPAGKDAGQDDPDTGYAEGQPQGGI